jgi:hypothetical protein
VRACRLETGGSRQKLIADLGPSVPTTVVAASELAKVCAAYFAYNILIQLPNENYRPLLRVGALRIFLRVLSVDAVASDVAWRALPGFNGEPTMPTFDAENSAAGYPAEIVMAKGKSVSQRDIWLRRRTTHCGEYTEREMEFHWQQISRTWGHPSESGRWQKFSILFQALGGLLKMLKSLSGGEP